MSGKKKRKKHRVAFRKNRARRARRQNLTRDVLETGLEETELDAREQVGKDEQTRYRTVVGVEEGEEGLVREVDEEQCLQGRVLETFGLNNVVRGEDGRDYECTVRRVVRTLARDERAPVATGDHVLFQPLEEEQGVIERVEPRAATLSRWSQNREHVIASNVDQVVAVMAAKDPPLKPNLIDRFLISAEKGGAEPLVVINKVDLVDPARLQPLVGVYARIGYRILLTSATTGRGVPALRRMLHDRQSVVTGQSGVGKSSLLNVVQPGLGLRTGEVSDDSGKGTHTTRSARMLELESGGWVIDTPGIRQFALWDVSPGEVEGYFVEFRPFVVRCKFPDCTHTHEAHCGVKEAVARELISPMRYGSYVRIVTGA